MDTSISVDKKEFIRSFVVVVLEHTSANDYKENFSDDQCEEVEQKYKCIINFQTRHFICSRLSYTKH